MSELIVADEYGREMGLSSTFRKAPPPKLGDKFGLWSGRDSAFARLPGGAVLQFDLSKLTLADYRVMKDHYQLNASMTLLTHMLHQIDWHIECEDQKIADFVDENLRTVWTRLVRGLSQAFWAGYSPMVIEYENNIDARRVEINKFKDLIPEDCEVNWEEFEGWGPPNAIKPKLFRYDGIKQRGVQFPIPTENTLWYSLLMENGDMYGRKLLKPAFPSWFFSTLIHLFANRYFERFGEPLPIGRADYDDQVEITTSTGTDEMVSGRRAMELVLQQIRNRSVVVLPSDRDPETKEFLYDIDYLEGQMRGADFERYMTRLDEEMSISLFTPMLLFRTGESGSYNLGVTQLQCVAPDTPILCADLSWRRADSLEVGDELIAFDKFDNPTGEGNPARRYVSSTVEATRIGVKDCYRVSTVHGDDVISSSEHPWLVWSPRRSKANYEGEHRNPGFIWKKTRELRPGDQLAKMDSPWVLEESKDAGWLEGMFDGEGCLARGSGATDPPQLTVSQVPGVANDRIKMLLKDRGFDFRAYAKTASSTENIDVKGGWRAVLRFLGTIAPQRLVAKSRFVWEGRAVRRNTGCDLVEITHIEHIGDHEVASLQTSSGTFIANGYLVSNTYLWSLNAIASDMKEYIDRFVCQRLKDINFSPKSPRVQWVPRGLGRDNAETLRAIITEMVRGDKVKPDLDELGQALGMTLQEIQEVKSDPTPTDVVPDPRVNTDPPQRNTNRVTQQPGQEPRVGKP